MVLRMRAENVDLGGVVGGEWLWSKYTVYNFQRIHKNIQQQQKPISFGKLCKAWVLGLCLETSYHFT